MGLLQAIKEEQKSKGVFAVIGGMRLGGKTTLSGTLPGKTLLLHHKTLESGYLAAQEKAAELGNDLICAGFDTVEELVEYIGEAIESDYDNIYIDSLSAVNSLKLSTLKATKKPKETIWDVFGQLGESMERLVLLCKKTSAETGINVFLTMAYKVKDNDLEADLKGNITAASITKLCPNVLAVKGEMNEDGKLKRTLITKSDGIFPARVDGLLDDNNPAILEANLGEFLNLFKAE